MAFAWGSSLRSNLTLGREFGSPHMNSDHLRWVGYEFVTLKQDLYEGHINHGVLDELDTYDQARESKSRYLFDENCKHAHNNLVVNQARGMLCSNNVMWSSRGDNYRWMTSVKQLLPIFESVCPTMRNLNGATNKSRWPDIKNTEPCRPKLDCTSLQITGKQPT